MLRENRRASNVWISVCVYVLAICHYASNTFPALPNLPNWWTLANTVCENQFLQLLINLCKNARECGRIFGICLFSAILQKLMYVRIQLKILMKKVIWNVGSISHSAMNRCPYQVKNFRSYILTVLYLNFSQIVAVVVEKFTFFSYFCEAAPSYQIFLKLLF